MSNARTRQIEGPPMKRLLLSFLLPHGSVVIFPGGTDDVVRDLSMVLERNKEKAEEILRRLTIRHLPGRHIQGHKGRRNG